MSNYYPRIDWEDEATLEQKVKATYNILNNTSREMYVGRVPQNKEELQKEIVSSEARVTTPLSIAFVKMAEKGDIDEVTASENIDLFLEWKTGVNYKANTLLKYEGLLYRVLQEHTSQEDWTPDKTPALYKVIGINENGIPEWSRPISSVDAYMTGDECMFNGVHKRSTIDNNVWSPDEYPEGWEDVIEENIEAPSSGDTEVL